MIEDPTCDCGLEEQTMDLDLVPMHSWPTLQEGRVQWQ